MKEVKRVPKKKRRKKIKTRTKRRRKTKILKGQSWTRKRKRGRIRIRTRNRRSPKRRTNPKTTASLKVAHKKTRLNCTRVGLPQTHITAKTMPT